MRQTAKQWLRAKQEIYCNIKTAASNKQKKYIFSARYHLQLPTVHNISFMHRFPLWKSNAEQTSIPAELQRSSALREGDRLTATIMMQLSRNPNPTKGRALCSRTVK